LFYCDENEYDQNLISYFAAPSKQFELAFKMFDNNGDGNLDQEEYERVRLNFFTV